ncbi:MAG: hypothetical protein FJ206_02600 [Gemmatimonadetes bacterium]|nr:hypothetical protein [Gemmatimonadota bacterium]
MAGSSTGDRARKTKADAPKPTRSITVRPPLWRSLAGRLTLAAAAVGVLVTLAIALVIGRIGGAVGNIERGVYAQIATDARLRLDRLTSRDRTRMMEAAFSDEVYQAIARGPAPPDSFIRPRFAERFVNLHGDQLIGLYGLAGERLFFYGDSADGELQKAATANAFLRTLDNREPNVGLLRVGGRLVWLAGAPVLPTNYADASQPIRGYLVVAQPFAITTLSGGVGERSGRLDLAPMSAPVTPFRTQVAAADGDSIRVEFALPDVFAQQTTLASFTTSRGDFAGLSGTLRSFWVLAVGLGIAIGVVLWLAATRLLVAPTMRTSAALAPVHRGELPNLVNSPSSMGEWTTIAGAINRLITNGRVTAERFQRMTGVVDDGAFERDLTSQEWILGSRLTEMLGASAADSPPDALTRALHPDDAGPVLAWLSADAPSPRRLSAEVRFRRDPSEPWLAGRIDAQLGTDLAGQPTRITGRLRDVSLEQSIAVRDQLVETEAADRTVRLGKTLLSLSTALRSTDESDALASRLEWIGRAMAGEVTTDAASFDLLATLQQAAGADPSQVELVIVPGVPSAVVGDPSLVTTLISDLSSFADRSRGRITLRAEQPEKARPELIRLVVETRGASPTDEMNGWLARGALEHLDRGAAPLVVHYLAAALGGRAGTGVDGERSQFWVELPLPAAPTPAAEPWSGSTTEEGVEFETIEPEPSAPAAPAAVSAIAEAAPELVADATVVIDFDAPRSRPPALGPRIMAALASHDPALVRTARIALADTPIRITELRGAIRAGESRTVSQIAQAVGTIADALEAVELARRCRDVLDAVEGQYLESADYLVESLQLEWEQVRSALAPLVPTADRPVGGAAIDPATLEQLAATTSADGLGLGNQLIGLFLAEAPARVDSAERAAERADLSGFQAAANDLRGMCGLIGATRLGELCAAAGRATDLAGAATTVEAVRAELRLVHDALESLLGVRAGA